MAKNKELKKITQKELDEIGEKHRLYLKDGDEANKADLSFTDFADISLRGANFEGANFEGANFSNIGTMQERVQFAGDTGQILRDTNFCDANFSNSNVLGVDFRLALVDGAIFINSNYHPKQFTKQQLEEIIETDKGLELKLKQKLKQKDIVIKNTGKARTNELQQGFIDLKDEYSKEEKIWLFTGITIFLFLFISTFIPILTSIGFKGLETFILFFISAILATIIGIISAIINIKEIAKKENNTNIIKLFSNKYADAIMLFILYISVCYYFINNVLPNLKFDSNFKFEKMLPFLPFEIICLTFLYFCIYQFSKAKNLRIEQQNKIAIISGYQALIAQEELTGKEVRMSHFLPNIADVLFCKANEKNDQSLPFDKALEIAKLVKDTTK